MAGLFDFILPPAVEDVTPAPPPPAAAGFIDRIFREILPEHMPGYEPREQQIQLAYLVARGLESGQHVTAEAGTGTGKCVHGDTLIPTTDGRNIPIHSIVESGELPEVWAMNPEYRIKAVRPINAVRREPSPLVTIKTRRGLRITVTTDHRFFTFPEWTEAYELKPGTLIAVPRIIPANQEAWSCLSDAEIDTTAMLIADGTITGHNQVYYAKGDPEMRSHLAMAVGELGCTARPASGANVRIGSTIKGTQNRVKRLMVTLGLYGCNSYQKQIPEEIFRLPPEKAARFVGLLWSGDGSVEARGRLSYSSMSEALVRQLQHLLLRRGVIARLRSKAVRYRGAMLTCYELSVYGEQIVSFARAFGQHLVGTKAKKLKVVLAQLNRSARNSNVDLVPNTAWDKVNKRLARAIGFRDGPTKTQGQRRISRPMLRTYAETVGNPDLLNLSTSDLFWDEVVSVNPAGTEETYCLTMPAPYHNFIANDMVVHNSLAVLAPAVYHVAIEHRGQVVVSTGTIALQEQYAHKDVPFLRRVLRDADVSFTAALAKGKGNYLCLTRLDEFSRAFGFNGDEQTQALLTWAETTLTGDKADLTEEPGPTWQQVSVDDSCTGTKCPFYADCHYYRAKVSWANADILICNHKLLLTDIASGGRVLPPHGAVILDEAHHLEGEALDVFGAEVSNFRVPVLLNEAKKLLHPEDQEIVQQARAANAALFQAVAETQRGQDRAKLQPLPGPAVTGIITLLGVLADALEGQSDKADNLAERALDIASALRLITQPPAGEFVAWAEIARPPAPGEPPAKVVLHATPTDVSSYLREGLFDQGPVVMTSATLATSGRFDYLRRSVGCPASLEMAVESPFNYEQQGVLFVPRGLPDPKSPDFYPRATPLIEQLLLHTDGRAFVLFTSYRGMNEVYRSLAGRLRWTVLRQGDAPKAQLLQQFKEDGNAVLFATASFWEGIDVVGEALSAVIIDKLPFPNPSDPVTEAKCMAIKSRGGSDFRDYFLPEAILRLRQGVGRLIRSKNDRGLVAILDSRLLEKGYGRQVLDSLPPFRRLSSLENIGLFFTGGGQA